MSMTFYDYIGNCVSNLPLFSITLLILSVILVNGWTDAPNAIATCVSTRSMNVRATILMAAFFNFLGVFVMSLINAKVAHTIFKMVDFGDDLHLSFAALCAALLAIVLWATAAWWFGIPTSESHALIAGLSGAAIASQGGLSGINPAEWVKVIYGLFLSTTVGFMSGWFVMNFVNILCKTKDRQKLFGFFKKAQIFAAAAMAFMHGAQDGQKFIGVFMLGIFLINDTNVFIIPVWLMIVCSCFMAAGTSIGGYRIIKSVCMNMVKLQVHQGFSADLAAGLCLLIASLLGLPVSTTHTKITAIMGVGAAKKSSSVNWGIVRNMIFAWIMTFPGCGFIGFSLAWLFIKFL